MILPGDAKCGTFDSEGYLLNTKGGRRGGTPSGCGFWNIEDPRVINAMAGSVHPLSMAACRCKEINLATAARKAEQLGFDDIERWRYSNLPHLNTGSPRLFSTFHGRTGATKAFEACHQMVDRDGPPILLLIGGTGSGRTHLLEALGREALRREQSVRYETAQSLADRYRNSNDSRSIESTDDVRAYYRGFDLMLVDELREGSTTYSTNTIVDLVDDREQRGGRLVMASNLIEREIAEHYDDRLASRLFSNEDEVFRTVILTASDYRKGNGDDRT